MLDCCHSAGLTRRSGDGGDVRCLDLRDIGSSEPQQLGDHPVPGPSDPPMGGVVRSIENVHVVAACQEHEQAREFGTAAGRMHGVFTEALHDALAGVADDVIASGRRWPMHRSKWSRFMLVLSAACSAAPQRASVVPGAAAPGTPRRQTHLAKRLRRSSLRRRRRRRPRTLPLRQGPRTTSHCRRRWR